VKVLEVEAGQPGKAHPVQLADIVTNSQYMIVMNTQQVFLEPGRSGKIVAPNKIKVEDAK
jgi:hypothetical protein